MAEKRGELKGEEGHLPGKCWLTCDFLLHAREQTSVADGNHFANEMESRALERQPAP